jgi:hypothetical protein
MSLPEEFKSMRLVKVGPSLSERLGQQMAAIRHKDVIACLRRFREQLERDMEPESWTLLECSAVLLLSDVCDALRITEEEKAVVLGQEGVAILRCELATSSGDLNARQVAALSCVRKHGEITLSTFRAVCPQWSDETLRLDLTDLVRRRLLSKDGDKKGTRYTLLV